MTIPPQPQGFARIVPTKKSGNELLARQQQGIGCTVLDFWRWGFSDLINNATRGILAEYIVAAALNLTEQVRGLWDAYDLITASGIKVEVKSAAYLQSWYHKQLSTITFSIRPTQNWEASTNEQSIASKRQADIYVFCLLSHQDKATLDPLNLDQWAFYVLPAGILNERCLLQKTIRLAKLLKLSPHKVTYEQMASTIEQLGTTVATAAEQAHAVDAAARPQDRGFLET